MSVSDELRAAAEQPLSDEEARAYIDAPISDEEREEVLALRHWFTRRYPEGAARLAYVRAAYARWRRTLGVAWNR